MFEMFQCGGVLIGLRGGGLDDPRQSQTISSDLSAKIEIKAMRRLSQFTTPSKASKTSKTSKTSKVESNKTPPLQACMVFREYNPAKEGKKGILRRMVGLMSHTCAYLEKEDNSGVLLFCDRKQMALLGNFMSRADELETLSASWHAKYGPPGVHWYLSDVAVKVSGQGHGTRLMTALTQMADRYDLDIYLECGPGETVDFFSKFDFQVMGVEELPFENATTTTPLQLHLMVRKAASRTPSSGVEQDPSNENDVGSTECADTTTYLTGN
jgi:hypothetical protein